MTALSVATWQGILKSQQTLMNRNANSAAVKNALDYFNKNAPKVTKVDDLLKDRKLLNTVLVTYGLESEINNVGRLRQLLTQDPKEPKSLVNRLVDTRYTKFVVDLNFFSGTPAALKDPNYAGKVADAYKLNTYETNLGNQDPALREAAYFMRQIGGVTDVYQILGDKVLRDVVTKALQLPAQFASLDVEKQAAILKQRLNIKDLQSALGKNAQLYSNAAADQVKIGDVTKLSDKAAAVVKSLTDNLSNIEKLYNALPARQDPSGVNSAKITQQNSYLSDLINVRGLIDTATSHTTDMVSGINRLKVIADTIGSATTQAQFDALQAEYLSTAQRLSNNIADAAYADSRDPLDPGKTRNLLTGETTGNSPSGGPFTLTFNVEGSPYSFSSVDLNAVKATLDAGAVAIGNATFGGAPVPPSLSTALQTASDDATTQIGLLNQQAQKYGQAVKSASGAISPFQEELLSRAASSVTDATNRATQINSLLIKMQSALEAVQSGTANRALVDADVQKYKADLEKLVRGNAGNTDNLLIRDGQYGSTNGIALSVNGGDFLTDIVDKLKDVNAFSDASAKDGASYILQTLRPLVSSTINSLRADGAYVQSAAASSNFAVTPNTADLRLGSQSAADALSRLTQMGTLLGQLQGLANTAITNGDGSTDLNTQASDLIQKITTLYNTAGTGLDNLLVGTGSESYNFVTGTDLSINKQGFDTLFASLGTDIDLSAQGNTTKANDALVAITDALSNITRARSNLTPAQQTIDTARKSFDPRAPIDDLFAATVANITTQVSGATVDSKNLLTSAADQLLFLKSTPGTYTVSGHSEFDMQVTRGLQDAVKTLLTSATVPTTAIHQSILQLNSIYVDLTGDITVLKHGTSNVTSLLDDKAKAEAAAKAAPYQGTRLAKQLTNQFLAFDQSGSSQTTLGMSLAQILGGNSSTTNILNLLI